MRQFFWIYALAILPALAAPKATSIKGALTPAWVELGDTGKVLARVVIKGGVPCPAVRIGKSRQAMTLRQPIPDGMEPVCELAIPAGTAAASVGKQPLVLPKSSTTRVVVVGDTGCRIKGERIQDCNDPAKWPLQRVANRAAAEKPDLILHVGDYLYREDKCPPEQRKVCGDGPAGDSWATWQADFFAPAAKLLAAAPWAFSRGNHEDCERAWKGWFYYLDPRPLPADPWNPKSCVAYSDPYQVRAGNVNLFMLDSSAWKAKVSDEQVDRFAAQLAKVQGSGVWIVDHHPFWHLQQGETAETPERAPGPLAIAFDKAKPAGVSMVVSGHTHLFELLTIASDHPTQLIAGDGGTALSDLGPVRADARLGTARREFGYTLMTQSGAAWTVEVKAPVSGTVAKCVVQGSASTCGESATR